MTKQRLEQYKHHLRVSDLQDFIKEHNIPGDAHVLVQRIEDEYYTGVDISGMHGEREDGTYGILPEGSKAVGWEVYEKSNDGYPAQYTPAWCCVHYKEDPDILFIDLHY